MRRELLPGVLQVAKHNLEEHRQHRSVRTRLRVPADEGQAAGRTATPRHRPLRGRRTPAAWDDPQGVTPSQYDFYDLKGVIESLASDLHLPAVSFTATQSVPWLHPMRAAELRVNGNAVGVFGELHPKVAANFGLADRAVQVAEIDLELLLAAVPERYGYKPYSAFPPAKRDIAIIVAEDITVERVLAESRAAGGDLLTDATLFDVYRGTGLPDGTKSLAFALTYQSLAGTLTDNEIKKAHEKVQGRLRHILNAHIRGEDDKKDKK